MAVKIRMSRQGRRHRPFFRINVIDVRTPRDGRIVEKLGHYDPLEKNKDKQIVLDIERAKYWLDKGAIPSDTISEMLLHLGIKHKYAEEKKVRRALARKRAKARGIPFTSADRLAAQKAAEAAKAAAEQKAKEEEEKAKQAEKKAEEKKKEEKKEKPAEATQAKEQKEKPIEKKEEKPAEEAKPEAEEAPQEKPKKEKKAKPAEDVKKSPAEEKPEEKPEA